MRTNNGSADEEKAALTILTVAVLAIIVTAPIGAALIAILGPRLLDKDGSRSSSAAASRSADNDRMDDSLGERPTPIAPPVPGGGE